MKPETKREVLIARAAFENGARWFYIQNGVHHSLHPIADMSPDAAKDMYSLPRVTRPRVVNDPHGSAHRWTVRNGIIRPAPQWSPNDLLTLEKITPARVALWADLLANPNETVEDDT